MIDAAAFRQAESQVRQSLNSWRPIQIQSPHIFANSGFPVRIETIQELVMLVDTMQENRFDPYMVELGGMTDAELGQFVASLVAFVQWYATVFRGGEVPVPLSTMIAHFALNKKIMSYPNHRRILEIGPGCGYLSFYLAGNKNVETYCQVEVTESFYVFQNLLNTCLYGPHFVEHVTKPPIYKNTDFQPAQASGFYEGEVSPTLHYAPKPTCEHFPWWETPKLRERKFDIITSNANFTEMSEPAFQSYAQLISQCLDVNGMVLAQCLGGGHTPIVNIIRTFESLGFRVLALIHKEREMVTENMILVREGHPSYDHAPAELTHKPYLSMEPLWVQQTFAKSQNGTIRSAQEVLGLVREKLLHIK